MLWDNIDPVFELWLLNIEFHNFLERCVVVSLEVERASDIVNVVIGCDPLRYNWLDGKFPVKVFVFWFCEVSVV